MQEHRWDGSDELQEVPGDKLKEKLLKALEDERNKAVTMHKAGSVITRSDGSQYVVGADGAFRKIKEKD